MPPAVPGSLGREVGGLGAGVPGRDRQPEHIGEGPGVAVRDLAGERRDLGAQHRLGRHDPLQVGEPPAMFAGGRPLQQVAARQLAGEPHPDPAPGDRGLRQPLWHEVVERPVEVGERDVHGDPGHRQLLGWRPGAPAAAGGASAIAACGSRTRIRSPWAGSARRGRLVRLPCHASVLPEPSDPWWGPGCRSRAVPVLPAHVVMGDAGAAGDLSEAGR